MSSRKNVYSDVNKMLLSGNDNAIMMASSPSPGNNTNNKNDPVELRRMHFLTPALSGHPAIAIVEFPSHVERLKANNNNLFSLEYESIDPAQQFTWEASNSENNKHKNRYANVVAYDSTRVLLKSTDTILNNDYINANHIDGYRSKNAYIATQGPSPETYDDFWRMVWEAESDVIVMITRLEERNRVKCNRYWPCRGTEMYNNLEVALLDTNELTHYTIRTFTITKLDSSGEVKENKDVRREVKQFQFTSWPDHGVPLEFTSFSLFVNRIKSHTHNHSNSHSKNILVRTHASVKQSSPVIVHCSAGVGRTGVYIIIDSMLERIKHEATLDIYGHVTCLRAQRNYMVQTEDQYIFIHDFLLDYMRSGNTEVQARNLYSHIQHLSRPDTDHPGKSLMQSEFARLNDLKIENLKVVSAQLAWNKHKNKLASILPYESSRVCLMPIRGVEGSDYINANFIDGYKQAKAYIATQGPMTDTIEDFWRMAWECNSTIIVVLCKPRELGKEMYQQYWPNNRSARYQYYVVDPMAEYNMPQYILREFKVTDARDGHSRTMRQFQFTDWPEEGVPQTGEGFIDFIGQVHKTKEQFGQEGPITVHCNSGAGRTGVFTALSHLLERMRSEGVIDLFITAKLLRLQRPRMLQTEEQYAFCYRSALEYLGSFDHYAD